jgi:type III pantothenate kinase
VAVDVGNTRLKLGVFQPPLADPLPHPIATLSLGREWSAADLDAFLPLPPAQYAWTIASVNRPACAQLVEWLAKRGATHVKQLSHADLPLAIDVEEPSRVGMDRLVNAVAINRLRQSHSPAIIIDMGTALKLDVVSGDGAFAGGSISLGIAMSARALHEFTDLLPLVEVTEPPPAIGKSTRGAMNSGLYWGAVGAVRELIAQITATVGPAEIYLTGGAGPLFTNVLDQESTRPPQFVPHLTLAGIALAAQATGTP